MTLPSARRRTPGALRLVAVLASVAVLAACSSTDDSAATTPSPSADATTEATTTSQVSELAEPGAFPVTVEHVYGETVIDTEPQRIVTIGWSGQDAVLALGKVPLAVEGFSGPGIVDDVLPWNTPFFGGNLPETLTSNPEVPFEQIMALDPDLILAVYSGISEEDYTRLTSIAPTVAFPEVAWATSWQDQTTMIGAALGQPAKAAELVAGVGDLLDEKAAENPSLAGKTFTYAMSFDEIIAFCPGDPRIEMLTGIGMELSAGALAACDTDPGASSVTVSSELVPDLDADVFILVDVDETVLERLSKDPLFSTLPSVVDGRVVQVIGMDYAMATSAPTVLSIPYALDKFLEQLTTTLG